MKKPDGEEASTEAGQVEVVEMDESLNVELDTQSPESVVDQSDSSDYSDQPDVSTE